MEMRKQSFIRGTFVLTASALVTRVLGFVNGILLARFLGQEGVGLLMIAHPLLPLFITITELGLPPAISKLVSEAEVRGDAARVKKILVVSLSVTGVLSVALTLLALFGAKWIAAVFLPDQRAYYAMIALTPIIPIVAITAVLRGYFRGKQNMNPLALSEIFENLVQIAVVIGVVNWLLPYGVEYAAAGAMISAVLGEGAGLLFLLATYRMSRNPSVVTPIRTADEKPGEGMRTLTDLLRMGLPLTGSGLIHSAFHAFMPTLVIQSLLLSGVGSASEATKQFGLLMGYAFPLLYLPSFFTQSLSTALIPAISEATVNRNKQLMHERMDTAMRIALFAGVPCTVIVFLWAEPLTAVIYHAPEAGILLKWLTPFFFFYYFQAPLHAILLGLGKASTVMWNLIAANAMQIAAILIFGSKFGIRGVAFGIGLCIFLLTVLHFLATSSAIGFCFDLRNVIRAAFAAMVMILCGTAAHTFLVHAGAARIVSVTGAVLVSLLVYAAALRLIRVIRMDPGVPVVK